MNLLNHWPPNLVESSSEIVCGGETDLLNFQSERAAQRKPAAFMVKKKINFLIKNCFPI